jgi:hypothetical protein
MPHLEFFVVSESFAVDASTSRVSIFNVLEEVAAVTGRPVAPSMAIVALWNREPGDEGRDFQASVIIHTSGEQTAPPPRRFDVNFRMDDARARTIIHLQNYPTPAPCEIRFELLLNGEHKANHLVRVHVVPAPVQ